MPRRDLGGTPATVALTRAGIRYVVHTYEHDPGTPSFGLEAAAALGVEPQRVLKTLLVDTGSGLAVAVVPVDRSLDLKAVAAALGVKKVAMAQPRDAERSTGYVVGGISPVGQRRRLPTVIHSSVRRHETVLVSGGRRGMDVEVSPVDLVGHLDARIADIAR